MKTNQPIVTKDVDNLTQVTVSGIYTGPCKPPYLCDFIWMVEAVSKDGHTDCAGEPTTFRVTEENVKSPANLFPEDKKQFTSGEAMKGLTFRWTPVVPKPQEPVTYRMKVWQLMQGQSSSQAMKTNKPIVTKDVVNLTEATVSNIYTGPCRPPYLCDFVWAVDAITGENNIIGISEHYTFKVADKENAETQRETTKEPPKLSVPDIGKIFSPKDMSGPILFRWTPVVPKPQEPVTYRLKVWQLMQGQNGSQAMRTNKPIVTKDVIDITEATVSGIYTGPCRPPYLCDFVWSVQALDKAGNPVGVNKGTSEAFRFGIREPGTANPPALIAPADNKIIPSKEATPEITFRWTPVVPKPQEPVTYRLKVWQLMQGQSGSQAMRTNQPIVTKDVADITETTVSGIYTGPCRPPYLCDFVWAVEVITNEASSSGISKHFIFKVAQK
jgi:hypothetical protein